MAEQITQIPARLKNIANNGHVAGASDIIDDALNKLQSQVNQELITSDQTLDAKIDSSVNTEKSRAQAAETALQNAIQGLSQSDVVVGALPQTGEAGKIYRVPGSNSYSDYGWNGSQFVLMATYNNAIDDVPMSGSDNLVKSGGVANSIFEGNILQRSGSTITTWNDFIHLSLVAGTTYKIHIDRSAENIYKYWYLKDHTFVIGTNSGVTLLNMSMENGETSKTFIYTATTTEDAYITTNQIQQCSVIVEKYINIDKINPANIDSTPTTNSTNLVTSGGVKTAIDAQGTEISQLNQNLLDQNAVPFTLSIDNAVSFDGHLDSSNRIVAWGQAKHIVICVRGGDSFNIVPRDNNCAIAFLKTYEVGATLPYSLDYATGSSFIGVPSGGVYTVPSDAKYLVIRKDNNNGINVLPLNLIINNSYDIAGTLWDEFGVIISDFNKISEYYNGTIAKNVQKLPYLNNVTKTVVGVSVTCHADGTFDFVGTCTSNGGRTAALTGTFHLDAGTYKMRVSKKAPSSPSSIVYYLGATSVGEFNTQLEKDITISTTGDYFLGVNLKKDGVYNLTGQMIEIIATETSSTKVSAFDAVARDYINKMGIPVDFAQKDGIIKVNKVISSITGYQGMCEIDGVLYSCGQGVIYVPQSGDNLFGTKAKNQGISVHNNDVDYCYITDTFITACVPDDNLPMALYLLMDAKSKLNSDTALTSNDWLQILMPSALDDEYIMVGNCFGERSDIVYCILIDKADNFSSANKRILKLQLGVNSSGVYDGTYTILSNREWPYILEIQGSKYCNGKLYVGTDSYINTGSVLHAGITTIDINNLITIEYPAYATLAEKSLRIESEGIAFIGDKIYQIVIDHTNSVRTLREYDRFNL